MKKMTMLVNVAYHKKGEPGFISNEVRPENSWVVKDKVILGLKEDYEKN
jgi:hypothetical protein